MKLDISPMLNAYPDSMGGTLHDSAVIFPWLDFAIVSPSLCF